MMSDLKSRVAIQYGDVAPGAKENFDVSTDDKASFINLTQLNQYNLDVQNYANPCEQYSVLLDSKSKIFPEYPENENMGFWSESITDVDGNFNSPIVIGLYAADGNYSSQGLTFTFDTYNNIFCNNLNVKWYQGETLLFEKDFQPTSAFYFCRQKVEYYNKIIVTFYSMNMPYNRLKIRAIDYGYGTYFYSNELKTVNVIQDIDPVSREAIINTVDFTLDSKSDMEYNFQQKQPLSIYFNNKLIQTNFVDTSKRTGERQWQLKTNDYIGLLDKITFTGGIYINQNPVDLLETISAQTNVPFEISNDLNDIILSGYIPICTCRQAIQHIAFACGVVVDTSGSDAVKFFVLEDEVKQTIPLSKIKQGQSFETIDKVTEVQLTQHSYVENNEDIELYNTENNAIGTDIFVQFSSPCHSLSITNGVIKKSSANFAIIDANDGCILSGKGYDDNTVVKSMKNPNILASDIENITTISDETLITESNVDKILLLCYNYYSKNEKINTSIYDNEINVGDVITVDTLYLGQKTGRITSQRYNLNGGLIVKECEII